MAGETFTIYEGANPEALSALVEAAHSCGLADVKLEVMTHGQPGVIIPESDIIPSPYSCTMDWVRSHPETGLKTPS